MIDPAWLPAAKMERVIVHWTAGTHKASDLDRKHYHILIEKDGSLVRGTPSIDKNSLPSVKPGYAAHTLNCNTGSIGISLCGMAGAVERPFKAGRYPITPEQWETASTVISELCRAYSIPVTPKTVLSHAEVQANLGVLQKGKWDISILPFDRSFDTAREVGDRLRAEVTMKLRPPAPPRGSNSYTVTSGDTLWNIARSHGTTLPELLAANPKIIGTIHPGDRLTIPA